MGTNCPMCQEHLPSTTEAMIFTDYFKVSKSNLDLAPARCLLAQYHSVFLESRIGLSGVITFIAESQSLTYFTLNTSTTVRG